MKNPLSNKDLHVSNLRLTRNFFLSEFITSQTAERCGYDNTPNDEQINNLRMLCVNVLQPLRDIVLVPIIINSGYRCTEVNLAVGGKSNSQHIEGKAADLIVPAMPIVDIFNIILQSLPFDQMIFEFGRWVHVSWNNNSNRHTVWTSCKLNGKTVYDKYTSRY